MQQIYNYRLICGFTHSGKNFMVFIINIFYMVPNITLKIFTCCLQKEIKDHH